MNDDMLILKKGPIPLVIGVTGHRDLRQQDIHALREVVRLQIEAIQRNYPHTRLVVLSPLAEGADRLVAEVALELGAELVAPLPMPMPTYEKDFITADSRQEFHKLITRSVKWFEMPLVDGCSSEGISSPGPQRDLQYAQVGVFVARHSQIVIALWNGKPTELVGGMAQVVKYRLEGGIPEVLIGPRRFLEPEELGPVIHILTPRTSSVDVHGGLPLSVCTLYPGDASTRGEVSRVYERIWTRIDQFNREAVRLEVRGHALLGGLEALLPDGSRLASESGNRHVPKLFAVADTLAMAHQHAHRKSIWVILWAVVVGASALEFFHSYGGILWMGVHWGWIPITVFLLVGGGSLLVWYVMLRRKDVQSRYLDYRALAEGLRVQFFWDLACVRESVAEHYLAKQVGELAWIRHALRTCVDVMKGCGGETGANASALKTISQLATVNNMWVKEQARYYAQRLPLKERREHAFRIISKTLAFGGFLLVLPLLAIVVFGRDELREHTLLCVCAIFGIMAAAITAYLEVMAFEEEARQYRRMVRVFEQGGKLVDQALANSDFEKARTLLAAIGDEALAENGDWVLTHRARPLDLPEL